MEPYVLLIYLFPIVVALFRRNPHWLAVALGTLLTGWTGIGWLCFLALAFNEELFTELFGPAARAADRAEQLRTVLGKLGARAHLQEPAAQAGRQLRLVRERLENFKTLLDGKLSPQELTYSRYLQAAEQAHLLVFDNLSLAASLMQSVESADPREIRAQLEALAAQADQAQAQALRERLQVIEAQTEKISALLGCNEVAMTELDKLAAAFAQTNIVAGRVPAALETVLADLQNLTAQAPHYARL